MVRTPPYCPAYPKPIKRGWFSRWVMYWRLWRRSGSLLDQLTETSYRMQMGKVPVPGHDMYIVNVPEAVRKVLVEESGSYPKHRFMQDLLRPLVGDSVFTSNGEAWRSHRFLTESVRASASKAFLPFSVGPRVCVGTGFAMQEAALALAMLVRKFRIQQVDGHRPVPVARLSLRSDIGIKVKLERRHP